MSTPSREPDMSTDTITGNSDQTLVTTVFQGYNTFTGSAMSTALEGNVGSSGAEARSDYTVCYSLDEVRRALDISASVSYDFGFGSVDLKTDYMSSLNLTTYSVSIVVYTNIISDDSVYNEVNLIDKPPTDLNAFFQVYGDSFVSELVHGAEYIATYVFYGQSEEDQQSIKSTLSANAITDEGTLDASLQASFTNATKQVSFRQGFKQIITGFQDLALPDSDHILSFALDFSKQTPNAPTVISYGTTGYEHVPHMTDFTSVVTTRNQFLGSDTTPGIAGQLNSLLTLRNQLDWIKQVYNTYTYTNDGMLFINASQVDMDLKAIGQLILQINGDPTQNYATSPYPSLGFGTPLLVFTLSTPATFGNTAGEPFQDITPTSILNQTVLTSIQAYGGPCVEQLICTYSSASGTSQQVSHGTQPDPKSPFFQIGLLSNPFYLTEGEQITGLYGTAGKNVNQLGIHTNTQAQPWVWPPNPEHASVFQWSVDSGVFVGFQGRCSALLNQIQPVVCTFAPAQWSQTP